MKNKAFKLSAIATVFITLTACATFADRLNTPSASGNIDLNFDPEQYEIQDIIVNGETIKVRAFEQISYVSNPVETEYQRLNFYVPDAFFSGDSINGFNLYTAPIFMPNQIDSYMPSLALTAKPSETGQQAGKTTSVALALSKGFVVATPATRGRTQNTGKAPAPIIDLKAAVRYLHANDMIMAGDATKIIANGTSAGGALTALLGASGNNEDFLPELEKIGAADGRDDIFAVSAYAPTTHLEYADRAYEWQFAGHHHYRKIDIHMLDYKTQRIETSGILTDEQIELSQKLKSLFPVYINQLALKDNQGKILSMDIQGEGSFKTWVKSHLIQSAQTALNQGINLSDYPWLTIQDNKVMDADFDAYITYLGRMKLPPAFDALDLSNAENQLFGTEKNEKQHFTDFSVKHHQGDLPNKKANEQDIQRMNPMYYIGKQYTHTAPHWRIRHGSLDRETALAIPIILATQLNNKGYNADFALVWGQGHGGDYDLDQLFEWVKQISE